MNFRNIVFQFGLLLLVLGAFLLLLAGWTLGRWWLEYVVDGAALRSLAISGVATAVLGLFCVLGARRESTYLGRREALLLVAITWLIGGLFAALPYYIWAHFGGPQGEHPFDHMVDCYFESVSGLTTAGSSVLTDIESVPKSLIMWRAFTQWVGGIGIVVLFVAVFPSLGVGAKKLFQSEVPGVKHEGVMPTVRATARVLLIIYVALTALESLALWWCGMSLTDAVAHSFTTLATGGFSPSNTSIGGYDSLAMDLIIILFMVAGAINFSLYYHLILRGSHRIWENREMQWYLGLLVGATVIIALLITGGTIETSTGKQVEATFWQSMRYAAFNIVSVSTTTGYATADYNQWPVLAQAIMFSLILFGGCAGSTAGGLKIVRVMIGVKVLLSMIERSFRPQVVRSIRVSGEAISHDLQLQTLGYILATLVILSAGTLLLMVFEPVGEIDITTAASANLATFCTTGPGFGKVGPVTNYGWLSAGSKLVLCGTMVFGRLELFAILVLFLPHFWRAE